MAYQIERRINAAIPQMALSSKSYIVAHESGNGNNIKDQSLENEVAYMNNNWTSAFVPYWVGGGGRIIQIAEDGFKSWGAGPYANPHAPAQVELARCDTLAEFKKDYAAFVWLLRHLADKFNIPKTLDTGRTGIMTHEWVSNNLGGTDHTDPFGYLSHWGISRAQFKYDVQYGVGEAAPSVPTGTLYRVQTGAFSIRANAEKLQAAVKAAGFDTYLIQDGAFYKVQIGAFAKRENAEMQAVKVRAAGYDTFITTKTGAGVSAPAPAETIKHEYIWLPKENATWRVYNIGVAPIAGNECGSLAPAKYGGLEYPVQRWVQANVAIIKTYTFGEVQIYVGPETGASRYWY